MGLGGSIEQPTDELGATRLEMIIIAKKSIAIQSIQSEVPGSRFVIAESFSPGIRIPTKHASVPEA